MTDDEPAPLRDWLPGLAAGARGQAAPARAGVAGPAGHGRVAGHDDRARGASNARAKKELGWTLRYPSWREGFPAAYGR